MSLSLECSNWSQVPVLLPILQWGFPQCSTSVFLKLLHHTEAGKDWAQYELGECYMHGKGVIKDRSIAGAWYKKAADQGHLGAMASYGFFLRKGFPEKGILGFEEESMKYAIPAARRGHSAAQFSCAITSRINPQESLTWCLLAAAQGSPPSDSEMGIKCRFGLQDVRPSIFAAIFWFRRAATKGFPEAAVHLSECLIEAKITLFDGVPNIAGFSAIPEARFWSDTAVGLKDPRTGCAFESPKCFDLVLLWCTCCHTQASEDVALKRCSRCKAAGYCSKACQAEHWKLGHKIDCKNVDKCRVAYERKRWQ
jgi:TPR repeat protein